MKAIALMSALLGLLALGQINIDKEKSTIKITGTSSLHDWEMTVDEFDVDGEFTDNSFQNLEVKAKSKSMKSGKSVMDNKAYDAVNADKYATILFSANTLKVQDGQITGKGTVTLAGISKEVDFSAKILSQSGNEMNISGQLPLKMSDFKIEPPTAMFGTLKTGNEVTINYDIFLTN